MADEQKTPTFQPLGTPDASAVCGPDGCNIAEHRQAAQTQATPEKK